MEFETVMVESNEIACEGNDPALGHPRVFLKIGDDGEVVCPYCSRRFVKAGPESAVAEG